MGRCPETKNGGLNCCCCSIRRRFPYGMSSCACHLGGCLLANAPDLFVWKWVPVCNLRSPLPFLSWGF